METAEAEAMIRYVKEKILRRPGLEIGIQTPLVSSGLVDSFALVEALVELERMTNLRIPAAKVAPSDMDTVEKMFETAVKFGRPKK